jgi:hypothetical protein
MPYLVLAYPTISDNDFEFIQNHRKVNDPSYFRVVGPHFTLVFSTSDFPEHEFIEETTRQAEKVKRIDFKIKRATVSQDCSKGLYHEFLVPDEGYNDIVRLHDRLYSGEFFKTLRFDIDFIPHIGIGSSEDALACKKNVDYLNSQSLLIEGSIQALDIVKYDRGKIKSIKKIELI